MTPCTPVSLDSLTTYPLVVPLGDGVNFEANILDGCGEIDALWEFDDGTVDSQTNDTSPFVTTKTYASAGVYTVVFTVSDDKVDFMIWAGDTIQTPSVLTFGQKTRVIPKMLFMITVLIRRLGVAQSYPQEVEVNSANLF